ncbi:hypothetical protein [Roseixanthobacter pseudopolyaromaticivorans]|uniref:hypothetical protein n=1 Tax=Xanthobacteraceae TaxID=335928 RepID=UPI003729D1AA
MDYFDHNQTEYNEIARYILKNKKSRAWSINEFREEHEHKQAEIEKIGELINNFDDKKNYREFEKLLKKLHELGFYLPIDIIYRIATKAVAIERTHQNPKPPSM